MREGSVPSNVCPEEFFNFYCTDERAVEYYDKVVRKIEEHNREAEELRKQVELLDEQLFFAQELVGALERALKQETVLSNFKKRFATILADSSFER